MISVIVKLFELFGAMPWLERYIGSGVNSGLLTQLVKIAKQIGGAESLEDALQHIKNNKELELEFQMALVSAEAEHLKVGMLDRQNARERDMEIRKLKGKNFRANIMLMLAAFGLVACLVCLFNLRSLLSPELIAVISTVAGIFGSCLKDAYSFEFGNSKTTKNVAADQDY